MSEAWLNGPPSVGDVAERSRRIDASDIALFTELSGDRNPLHYDEDVAAGTSFGRIVVQGGVTTAILNAVVAEDLPGPGTVFLATDWSFTAPVHPGDTITGRVEVTSVREDKPVCELATTIVRQDGVTVVEGTAICYTFPIERNEQRNAGG